MRLITPKRLKENEDAMWVLADRVLDTFLAPGEGEFIKGFAGPFTLLVIADLVGVPDGDRADFVQNLHRNVDRGLGSTDGESLAHSPLEFIYGRFATYIEDRRRRPRDDVLTGLATATFPDGSTPDVTDVTRVATNVFSAGQETTVRLLGTALQIIGERPDIQEQLRDDRSLIPNFISCPGAPLARAETRVAIERLLDRTTEITISERAHGPANDRRYQYVPTYILRGLTELHLEFTLAQGAT
jgi:cytochrome P450